MAVRSGPGASFAVIDSVAAPQSFGSCDSVEDWVGIVYRKESDPHDSTGDCGGLTSPIAERRPYRGSCRSGWIPAAAQEVLGG